MEHLNHNSIGLVNGLDNRLVKQNDIKINTSRNEIYVAASEIKKENENGDCEENNKFGNDSKTCDNGNETMKIKEINYPVYLEKCSDYPLTNLNETKIDFVHVDIKTENEENRYENEDNEELSTEDILKNQDEDKTDKELFNPINNVMDSKEMFYYYFNIEKDKMANNQRTLSFVKYKNLIEEIKDKKLFRENKRRCKPRDYWLLKHYDVLQIHGIEKLIVPLNNENSNILYYVHELEIYDILNEIHFATGHGGRDRMLKQIIEKYKNITRKEVILFLSLCKHCQQRQKQERGALTNPIIFNELNSCCQVDFIDYQSLPDNAFKFVMVYQDYLTKFVILRALTTKTAQEVCNQLIDIFSLFGAPLVLQLDNDIQFINSVSENLRTIWPSLKILHEKSRHNQNQGTKENANQDIKDMIVSWLRDHNSNKWSEALNFVQIIKNSSIHTDIKISPYEAMFGCKPKIGLKSSPHELIADAQKQLENITKNNNEVSIPQEDFTDLVNTHLAVTYDSGNNVKCGVCNVNVDNFLKICKICGMVIHNSCGIQLLTDFECLICNKKKSINNIRTYAHKNIKKQAKKIKSISDKIHPIVDTISSVRIPLPEIEKSQSDARSILGVVLENIPDEYYPLESDQGVFNGSFSRSDFSGSTNNLTSATDVPETSLSSTEIVKCSCKTKCQSKKCNCRKQNVICTSKCHYNHICANI